MKPVIILAVDTSCDDTSVAVTCNDRVLSSIVSSQIDVHKEWGGVVPNLARREHEKMIDECILLALKRAKLQSIDQVTALAVTYGPGLAPALEVGVRTIKQLAITHNRPVVAVNHMEGHTLSALLCNSRGRNYAGLTKPAFPLMALCVSGGHTEIVWVEKIGVYKLLGQTLDDAAGEAFDKVSRMLDLGYPGGPIISTLAEQGDPTAYPLPRPMKQSGDYNFSFSGLKTACLYNTNELKSQLGKQFAKIIPDYCASFQAAVIDCLVSKTVAAARDHKPTQVLLGGGVSANKELRKRLRQACKGLGIPAYFPAPRFSTDNAAMIGLAGYYKLLRGEIVTDVQSLDRDPSITIEDHL